MRIGAEGWTSAALDERATLLRTICEDAAAATRGGAVWRALAPR